MINLFEINKRLSLTIFFFSIICFILFDLKIDSIYTILGCFFLIATFGVSHGSLDHLKGYKILKLYRIKQKFIFYFIYVFISFITILFWNFYLLFTLVIFLIVASYHFGKEDSEFGKIQKRKFINFYYFLKGSIIILAPLYTNSSETLKIFERLNVHSISFHSDVIFFFIFLSILSNFFISKNIFISLIDSLTIIILNFTFNPLVAFTIYFCFLHSSRHALSLVKKLNNRNLTKGLKNFIRLAMPLTFITGFLFLISVYFLTNYYDLNDAILKVIFIGLASLTFPHILLEYLVEKNEKRT